MHIYGLGAEAPPLKQASLLSNNLTRQLITDVGLVHSFSITPTVLFHPSAPASSSGVSLTPPPGGGHKSWEIAVIAVMALFFLALVAAAFTAYRSTSEKSSELEERLEEQQVRSMSLAEIRAATRGFDRSLELGRGGYGIVYKGEAKDGTIWAVKRAIKATQKGGEFEAEIGVISRLHHRNIVRLLGYHQSVQELILVYEFMAKGTLKHLLQTQDEGQGLPFAMRVELARGAAEGLCYLHNYTRPAFIHRDIKTDNILVDAQYTAKVADFGLLKAHTSGNSAQKLDTAGTYGYIDPEYCNTQQVSPKSDVFSFGVVLLELITGRRARFKDQDESGDLVALASWIHHRVARPESFIDPNLDQSYPPEAMALLITLALSCVERAAKFRPDMDEVSRQLLDICTLSQRGETAHALEERSNSMANFCARISGLRSGSYSRLKAQPQSELENPSILFSDSKGNDLATLTSSMGV
eukprot:TRINITY_DN8021_c0_g1_i4.p1 TRINITY_DN8021_c0_g1~~TRINITY_DN8021_c0_g1_i4.p1  ORF type:complete len:469 (-),score=70.09 TRINITY_DN8021_c0_g1_i4:218-1624(-)